MSHPDVKRRKVVGALSILGLGSIGGCIPTGPGGIVKSNLFSGNKLEDTYQSLKFSSLAHRRKLGSYDPVLSNQSQAIFRSAVTKGIVPQVLNLPTESQADEVIGLFNRMKEKYEGRKELELTETYEVMQHLIPLTRMFVDLNSIDTSIKPTNSEKVSVSSDGAISVPPGYRVVSIQTGYCLDEKLPANGREDKMTISPATSLIPSELLPLYRAMQDKAYHDKSYRSKMQKLMWTLRAAGQPNSLASHVDAETLRDMDHALPGGADAFVRYHNNTVGSGGSINREKRNSANSSGSVAQQMFDAFMAGLANNNSNATDVAPNDNRNYQMLTPNVASFSVGNNQLKPQIEIINAGNEVFRINLADYIMNPVRKQQRIAMYPTTPENISYFKYEISPDQGQLELLKKLKDKVNPILLTEVARFLNDKFLKNVARSETFRKFAFRLLTDSPATKMILGGLPILGNGLSAYEAISGKNWLNGRDLNAFERVAAALGTIPGGGALSTVFRQRLVTVAGTIFAGAGFSVNQELMRKDVSAYSQAYTNPIEFGAEFAVDKINNNINQSLVQLSQDTSFSKIDRAAMLRSVGEPGKPQY